MKEWSPADEGSLAVSTDRVREENKTSTDEDAKYDEILESLINAQITCDGILCHVSVFMSQEKDVLNLDSNQRHLVNQSMTHICKAIDYYKVANSIEPQQ